MSASDVNTSAVVARGGDWRRVDSHVFNPADLVLSDNLVVLAKGCADTLERNYQGWLWCIRPDEGGGIFDIFSLRISGRLGYTLHTRTLQEDPTYACVRRAGGEILERFGFRRVPYTREEWRRRELTLGQFIPDVSDLPAGVRRAMNTDALKTALRTGHARLTTDPSVGRALAARAAAHV